jgi:hypothetical protein
MSYAEVVVVVELYHSPARYVLSLRGVLRERAGSARGKAQLHAPPLPEADNRAGWGIRRCELRITHCL